MRAQASWLVAGLLAAPVALATAAAAPAVQTVLSGTVHQALFSLAFDGRQGLAVGGAGEIEQSADGGKTWKPVASPSTAALLGVDLRGSHAIAVGQQGAIIVRGTQGDWHKVDSGSDARLFGVALNARGEAVAVGAFGTVLRSDDGGEHWRSIAPQWAAYTENGEEPHVYDVHLDDKGTATIVGEFGLILRSADAGASWQVLHKGEASLFALDLRLDGVGYAVGQSGTVLKTTDDGASWTALDAGTQSILLGVHSTADGKVAITAIRDQLSSRDDGASWQHVAAPEVAAYWNQGVTHTADGPALIVGQAGRIVRIGE